MCKKEENVYTIIVPTQKKIILAAMAIVFNKKKLLDSTVEKPTRIASLRLER